MSDSKSPHTPSAFDDLLDGDVASPDAIRAITDDVEANREAARESVKRAAAHVRAKGEHAARAAHEKAQAVGVSVRRHAPSVLAGVRQELAKPIRWRVVAPILVGSTVLAGAILAALLAWNAQRFATLDEQNATAGAATRPAPAPNAAGFAPAAPPAAASTTAAPSSLVATSPSAAPVPVAIAAPVAPEAAPAAPEPAPVSLALPPAPSDPSLANCTAAVPLLNGLFAAPGANARTPEETAWAAFGYRCAQNGALAYGKAGYAVKEAATKIESAGRPEARAIGSAQARPSVRTDKSGPRMRNATAPVATAVQPLTPTVTAAPAEPVSPPGTCVLRGSATTSDGGAMANVPVQIIGLNGSRFEQRINTGGEGRFAANVPAGARVRVVLRARGYLDDVRETLNCAPVALTGRKSNPLSSLFDAARRADRSIQGATGHR